MGFGNDRKKHEFVDLTELCGHFSDLLLHFAIYSCHNMVGQIGMVCGILYKSQKAFFDGIFIYPQTLISVETNFIL